MKQHIYWFLLEEQCKVRPPEEVQAQRDEELRRGKEFERRKRQRESTEMIQAGVVVAVVILCIVTAIWCCGKALGL